MPRGRSGSISDVVASLWGGGDIQVDPGVEMQDMRLVGPGRKVINKTGAALADGAAVALKTFNVGTYLADVVAADSNSATALYKKVIGFANGAIADNAVGTIVDWIVLVDVNTSAGAAGDYVYLKNDGTGAWEAVANADYNVLGVIFRSHATSGVVVLSKDKSIMPLLADTSLSLSASGIAVNLAAGSGLDVVAGLRIAGAAAGAGLTGGAGNPLNVTANADGSIVVSADDVQLGRVAGATAPAAGATAAIYGISKLHAAPAVADTPVVAGANLSLTAGAGLTGGGDLTANRTFDAVANADGSIVVNANDIQLGRIAGATAPAAGATAAIYGVSKLHAAPAVADTPVVAGANLSLTAGAGLTGGGDLTADRTFDVVANADGSIIANANDVQLGRIAGATAPSAGATAAIYGVSKLHAAPAVADTPVVAGANLTLTAGNGLTGGGNLTADRTFDIGAGPGIDVQANDIAVYANIRMAGETVAYESIGAEGAVAANAIELELQLKNWLDADHALQREWIVQVSDSQYFDTDAATTTMQIGSGAKGTINAGSGTATIHVTSDANGELSLRVNEVGAKTVYLSTREAAGANGSPMRKKAKQALVFA